MINVKDGKLTYQGACLMLLDTFPNSAFHNFRSDKVESFFWSYICMYELHMTIVTEYLNVMLVRYMKKVSHSKLI